MLQAKPHNAGGGEGAKQTAWLTKKRKSASLRYESESSPSFLVGSLPFIDCRNLHVTATYVWGRSPLRPQGCFWGLRNTLIRAGEGRSYIVGVRELIYKVWWVSPVRPKLQVRPKTRRWGGALCLYESGPSG